MIRYYKEIENGYVRAVGIGFGCGITISKPEYTALKELIGMKPLAEEGYRYRLKADTLDWEAVEV